MSADALQQAERRLQRMHISDPGFLDLDRLVSRLRREAHQPDTAVTATEADEEIADLRRELDAMARRIAELEQQPQLHYRGVWEPETSYARGSVVTASGSMWHASRATMERPGNGSADWVLCVKQGRPGRDGKDLR